MAELAEVAGAAVDFPTWWQPDLLVPQRGSLDFQGLHLETLILGALHCSPQVRADADLPLVQEARVLEAQAEFDVRAFVESMFIRTSDPVGSTLETGGPPRSRKRTGIRCRGSDKRRIAAGWSSYRSASDTRRATHSSFNRRSRAMRGWC